MNLHPGDIVVATEQFSGEIKKMVCIAPTFDQMMWCMDSNREYSLWSNHLLKPWQPTPEEREAVSAYVRQFIDSQGPMKF